MSDLFTVINGEHVPLGRCDWVMWGPCGCPFGVTVARSAPMEEMAWRAFYDTKREVERAQRRGNRMELMTHKRWCDEVADRMRELCTHGSPS